MDNLQCMWMKAMVLGAGNNAWQGLVSEGLKKGFWQLGAGALSSTQESVTMLMPG